MEAHPHHLYVLCAIPFAPTNTYITLGFCLYLKLSIFIVFFFFNLLSNPLTQSARLNSKINEWEGEEVSAVMPRLYRTTFSKKPHHDH